MMEGSFRVGLRVDDVPAAIRFYSGLGFEEVGEVPNPDGEPVMMICRWGEVLLIADALVGMPFPDSERERRIQCGPRGLGVVIGLMVGDLGATYAYCVEAGCEITCEPMDEVWGVRVFACLDPFGYEWEFSQPIADLDSVDGTAAVQESWFGSARSR
jgi:catechol 2,3-dioxygenase-like lactoylglutathione lyase family enzyme